MGQGALQASPTSPDSGISSGSSLDEINSVKKPLSTGSPKENVHFTFPRPAENVPETSLRSSVLKTTQFTSVMNVSSISSPNVITATTAAIVSSAVVRNFSYPTGVVPTAVETSVVQNLHVKKEEDGLKMVEEKDEKKEDACNLMCSDEEFSDESEEEELEEQGRLAQG